jgi:hypothetical protein
MRLSPLQFNNEPGTEAYGSVDDVASKLNQVIERVNLHSQLFIQLRNSNSAKMWTYKPMTIRVEHEAVSLCDKQGAHWPCDAVDFPSGSTQAPCPHHLDTMACEVCCPQDTWFK